MRLNEFFRGKDRENSVVESPVDPKEEIARLEAELSRYRNQLTEQELIEGLKKERASLDEEVKELTQQVKTLIESRDASKRQVENIKSENARAMKDIEHNVRLDQERRAIEFEKKTVALEREYSKKLSKQKEQHRAELNKMAEDNMDRAEKRFEQILGIVPNWKGKISGNV